MSSGLQDGIGRRVGVYPERVDSPAGPLVVVVGGLHGNEPSGVLAARRILDQLERQAPRMRGRFVALAGNLGALRERLRYRARDLNRVWTEEELAGLRARDPAEDDEEGSEQRELLAEIECLFAEPWERIVLLDLHSTSADGSPFTIMGDTLQNRRVAFQLRVPVILGLEERVDGTLLSWASERGHAAICLEGGQNDLESTVDHHEAALWITLVSVGLLTERDVPELTRHREALAQTAWGLPRVVEVRHRQPVGEDGFEMEPGYTNFHFVSVGDTLAHELDGEGRRPVSTPLDGLLLMPRYQGQGDDGFFVGAEVRPVWLHLSTTLRRLRLEWMLPLLPGIRRARPHARVLHVDTRVARWFVVEILHLFGYRRTVQEAGTLVFIRRRDA